MRTPTVCQDLAPQWASVVPPPAREENDEHLNKTRGIVRRTELRSDTPRSKVIESFFIHNGMGAKTNEFYQGINAYVAWLRERIDNEPTLADLDGDYVSADLRELETKPTLKYPHPSGHAEPAPASSGSRTGWSRRTSSKKARSIGSRRPPSRKESDSRSPIRNSKRSASRQGPPDPAITLSSSRSHGLRLSEARELRVADLNLDQCQVAVRAMTSKVRRSRTVDFHTAVAKEMDRYLRKRQNLSADAPLFPTHEGAFFKSTESLGKVFARIADDSGIRRFHAHLLRRRRTG